jgi:hypothetical protein
MILENMFVCRIIVLEWYYQTSCEVREPKGGMIQKVIIDLPVPEVVLSNN